MDSDPTKTIKNRIQVPTENINFIFYRPKLHDFFFLNDSSVIKTHIFSLFFWKNSGFLSSETHKKLFIYLKAWEIKFSILLVLPGTESYFIWIRIRIVFTRIRICIKVRSGSESVTNLFQILNPDVQHWSQPLKMNVV